jgi:hypothetical protein
VNFLAIGIDPTETADVLRRYQTSQEYPWPAAVGNREMLQAYNVTSTSTKYGMDRSGLVNWRRGYGVASASEWDELLRALTPG